MRALRIVAALTLMGAAPSQTYVIDAARSDVSARVAFFGLASKTARFPKVSGAIALTGDSPEQIDLKVRIDATALTAPDSVTLARLKGPKFFDVARFPAILFVGTRMRMTDDVRGEILGQITARGVTRPATLAVRFTRPPLQTEGSRSLSLDGETVIDRRLFGMTAYPLIVGRKVTIRIRAALVPG